MINTSMPFNFQHHCLIRNITPKKTQLCTNQLQTFNGRRHDLVNRYGVYLSQMTAICATCHKQCLVLSSFTSNHRVYNWCNAMGATSGAGTAYPSGAPEFTPGF